MTIELQALFGSALLLFALLVMQGALVPITQGFAWGLGSRDQPRELSPLQGRMKRVVANHIEGLAVFAVLVLVAHLSGVSSSLTQTGALLFLGARIAFALAYIVGIPVVRSAIWAVSVAGLLMITFAVLGAVF